ncbi:RNA 3'-terminal phosphate cyclase [Halovenus sp. HT40]|uniref:RNA 3'-terminal phosphate cyclase n=1 Tax=Halovenus sp. HT40 TaxID=3126691 RepID=UPI00300F5702
MLDIDGSAGGGQVLRSALALAVIDDQPIRLSGIRTNRPDPGLKPQHLAVVDTLADISNASVVGAAQGGKTIEFSPGALAGGHVTTDIGTAGSISLLFDAVLGLAVALDEPLAVTATGGTEVKWSPPLLGHQRTKHPFYRQFGLHAAIDRHRTGFYPAGGGRATLHLSPSSLTCLSLAERGALRGARIYSLASTDLADSEVARRQAETARQSLTEHGIDVFTTETRSAVAESTGSALVVELEYDHSRVSFDALGERGLLAEDVADAAVSEAIDFHDSSAVVDRHLADQLLLFLALAGGEMQIPEITDHVDSHLALLETFGYELQVDRVGDAVRIAGDSVE